MLCHQGAHFVLEQTAEATRAIRTDLPGQMPPDVLTVQNSVPHPVLHQGHPIRGELTVI